MEEKARWKEEENRIGNYRRELQRKKSWNESEVRSEEAAKQKVGSENTREMKEERGEMIAERGVVKIL